MNSSAPRNPCEGAALIPLNNRRPTAEPCACPVCGGPAGRKEKVGGGAGINTYCLSESCGAKAKGKIKRWISSLNILGIGDELLEALCSPYLDTALQDWEDRRACPPLVAAPADLYRLRAADIADLRVGNGRLGDSRAAAVVAAVQARKRLTLDEFLGSLGIEFLGKRRVQIVRELAAGQLDTLAAWRDPILLQSLALQCQIGGMVNAIVLGLLAAAPVIDDLLKVLPEPAAPAAAPSPAAGALSFCLTGAMSRPRKEIEAAIVAAGHVVKDGVAAGLSYLVMATPDSTSSKAKKAVRSGVSIISEDDLNRILS